MDHIEKLDKEGISEFCWGPDSNVLAYISEKESKKKIHTYNIKTESIKEMININYPIHDLMWSNNGGIVTFISEIYPLLSIAETIEFDDSKKNYMSDAIAFDSLPIYNNNHLFNVWKLYSFKKNFFNEKIKKLL